MAAAEVAFVPDPERWVVEGEEGGGRRQGGGGGGRVREVGKKLEMGGRVSKSDLF